MYQCIRYAKRFASYSNLVGNYYFAANDGLYFEKTYVNVFTEAISGFG
jgi:hypothetical protein